MAAGPPGICRVFPRHRNHLDNLFRRKRGGRAWAGVIGQGLHDHGAERFVTALVGFQLLQLEGQGEPPAAPYPYRLALEVHLAHHVALRGARLQRQQGIVSGSPF